MAASAVPASFSMRKAARSPELGQAMARCPDGKAYHRLNAIKRLWQYLKGQVMAGFLTNDGEALTTKLLESLQSLLEQPKLIRSVCATPSLIRK